MTQVGEGIADISEGGKETCCFCGRNHQQQKAMEKVSFKRDMYTLKKEGRKYSIANYSSSYPGVDMSPLIPWEPGSKKIKGYKAAAHHCISLTSINQHAISGELKLAKYDPNKGSNCAWLPYSTLQFSRARAYGQHTALQKHRGGHTKAYFSKVASHIERVANLIEKKFCDQNKTAGSKVLLAFMLAQEKVIWRKVVKPGFTDYHLYNLSYLDPEADWGTYPPEFNITDKELIESESILADDIIAEKESEDDPENVD